jgi:hypothetical protein
MALIVTPGGANSNSYVTAAEAAILVAAAGYDYSYWSALSSTQQEECLILAASALDQLPFKGIKVNRMVLPSYESDGSILVDGYQEQTMAFPRTAQYDRRVIPQVVKEAQVMIAAMIIAPLYPPVPDTAYAAGMADVKSIQIGPLSVTFEKKEKRPQLASVLSDKYLLTSSVLVLKLKSYLAFTRMRRVDSLYDKEASAAADHIVTTTTTTSTTTTSSSTTTTTA